jgi:hypothetical protein
MHIIKSVVDLYFDFMDEKDGNAYVEEFIPNALLNTDKLSNFNGTKYWKATESTITDEEIDQLETYYRHKLPISYKYFLKYRHFIELYLGQHNIAFFKNLPGTLLSDTKKEIENYYTDFIEANYLPFARMQDFGVLCFRAVQNTPNFDYEVVCFQDWNDHSSPKLYSKNFETMFFEFEDHLKDWIAAKRK